MAKRTFNSLNPASRSLTFYREPRAKAPVVHPGDEAPCLFGGAKGRPCLDNAPWFLLFREQVFV